MVGDSGNPMSTSSDYDIGKAEIAKWGKSEHITFTGNSRKNQLIGKLGPVPLVGEKYAL